MSVVSQAVSRELDAAAALPFTPKRTLEILKGARKRIKWGWCQDTMRAHRRLLPDKFCLVGALMASAPGDIREFETACAAVCCETSPDLAPAYVAPVLVNFNDRPGRTKREVLDVLDRAIAKAAL